MADPKTELVREWLAKASEDMQAALLLAERLPLPAGFHCQQAVEKAVKAHLIYHDQEFAKSHDLDYLLRLAAKAQPSLLAVVDAAAELTPLAVEFRYPGAVSADLIPARQALRAARLICQALAGGFPGDVTEGYRFDEN